VHPAKDVGWNEMPFSSDTLIVLSNIVLDSPCPQWEGDIWGSESLVIICVAAKLTCRMQ